jgi:hypothetical protein
MLNEFQSNVVLGSTLEFRSVMTQNTHLIVTYKFCFNVSSYGYAPDSGQDVTTNGEASGPIAVENFCNISIPVDCLWIPLY